MGVPPVILAIDNRDGNRPSRRGELRRARVPVGVKPGYHPASPTARPQPALTGRGPDIPTADPIDSPITCPRIAEHDQIARVLLVSAKASNRRIFIIDQRVVRICRTFLRSGLCDAMNYRATAP
jgi:hypothetical protein